MSPIWIAHILSSLVPFKVRLALLESQSRKDISHPLGPDIT